MANYDLEVSNSGAYNPLALQAFAEVQQGLTDQYNTSMAAYGELESKANLLEKLANDVKGKDSIAYQNYMNYANALRQHTDTLATYGINPNLTRNLMQARSDYSRIIHPIEEAWQARQNEAKRQADYLKAHPGTMFEKDASKMGIDEWLKNPTYQAQSVDLDNVSKIAGERFAAIKDKLQQFVSEAQAGGLNPATATAEDVKRWCKVKGVPYLYDAIEKYGANPDDVRALLSGDPRMMNSMLQHIVDETMAQTGVNTWNTDYDHYTKAQNEQNRRNIFERARGAIAGEATKSIGTDKFDKYQDNITWQKDLGWAQLAQRKKEWQDKLDAMNDQKNKTGDGKDITKAEDWYINRTSNLTNSDVQTSEANFLKQMYKFANNSGLGKNSANYIEFLLDKVGIDRKAIESGAVDINSPEVINAVKKLHESGKYSEKDANYFGAKQAGQELAAVGEVLAYIGGGAVNTALITTPLGWGMAATGWGRKLREDANYRAKISKLYEQARAGSKTAVEELKKEGILETGLSYEQKLKKLIDYQNDDAYDLDEQADMYIRGASTRLTGATSNWSGTSHSNATKVLSDLMNQAISGTPDTEFYDYIRDPQSKGKIKIDDFNKIANPDATGAWKNLPQIGLDVTRDGDVQVTLEFNATNDTPAKKHLFDDRLVTNGSPEREAYKKTMIQAAKDQKNATKLSKDVINQLHKEAAERAATELNVQGKTDSERNYSTGGKYNELENEYFKEARQQLVYLRALKAQSDYNEAKGKFFQSIGINTHDIHTNSKGVVEDPKLTVSHDPYIEDDDYWNQVNIINH